MTQSLRQIFSGLSKLCDKWDPYFDVYETYFRKFVGKSPKILEIGVYRGGSAEMWLKYFGEGSHVTGIDIDPDCKNYEQPGFDVIIGDTGDLAGFWNNVKFEPGQFDIIIDDGGHHMDQQIFALQRLWPALIADGVYLCEDTHTSYYNHWPNAGYQKSSSFMEYSKGIIDGLHSEHTTKGPDGEVFPGPKIKRPLGNTVKGIHYYDSMVVLEKGIPRPFTRVFSQTTLKVVDNDDMITIKI